MLPVFADHPYFVGVQYHPEYISRPMKPSPPYFGFLLAATGKLQGFVNRGFRKSPHMSYSESSDDELAQLSESSAAGHDLDVKHAAMAMPASPLVATQSPLLASAKASPAKGD